MTAICCMESETGAVLRLGSDALRSGRVRAEAKALVQDLWDLMPRSDDASANQGYLTEVRHHVRANDLRRAKRAIDACLRNDAETLNLRGVVSELLGEFFSAERAYKAALAHDPLCSAAKFNLRRCYELWAFGRSDVLLCL